MSAQWSCKTLESGTTKLDTNATGESCDPMDLDIDALIRVHGLQFQACILVKCQRSICFHRDAYNLPRHSTKRSRSCKEVFTTRIHFQRTMLLEGILLWRVPLVYYGVIELARFSTRCPLELVYRLTQQVSRTPCPAGLGAPIIARSDGHFVADAAKPVTEPVTKPALVTEPVTEPASSTGRKRLRPLPESLSHEPTRLYHVPSSAEVDMNDAQPREWPNASPKTAPSPVPSPPEPAPTEVSAYTPAKDSLRHGQPGVGSGGLAGQAAPPPVPPPPPQPGKKVASVPSASGGEVYDATYWRILGCVRVRCIFYK